MSDNIVNTIQVDYSLVRSYTLPYTKNVYFWAGVMFPNSKDLSHAIWNFGDGTTETIYFSDDYTRHIDILECIAENEVSFIPKWDDTLENRAGILSPRFQTSHTYTNPGTYEITVTLVNRYKTAFRGISEFVTVTNESSPYTVPSDWETISQDYELTDYPHIVTFRGGNSPLTTATITSASALPIDAEFVINNLVGRNDIDYIEFDFGDGTSAIRTILQAPITEDLAKITYQYKTLSKELSFKPRVTIYHKGNTFGKYRFTVPTQEIVARDRTNIGVSFNGEGNTTIRNDYAFNITPTNSSRLPVSATIYHKVTPNLKYIMWNFDDGSFDVIPVIYSTALANLTQIQTTTHVYNSVNYYTLLPSCVYVYESNSGVFYTERHQVKNFLRYDGGIINLNNEFLGVPVTSVTNYKRENRISSLIVYPETNTGSATLELRLSLDKSHFILLFEKIVWNINGVEITQDKNTSKQFGHLTVPNIVTPFEGFTVEASLYGRPAQFSIDNDNTAVVLYDTYSTTIEILDKDVKEASNANTALALRQRPVIPEPVVTTLSGLEVVTGVVEEETTLVQGEDEQLFLGGNLIFDRLFEAYNPAGNFLNRDNPTCVSTSSNNFISKRAVGFFKPSKASTIVVDPGEFTFTINADTIDFYKPYYFPDPFKYGSNTEALTFSIIDTSFKKGLLFGEAYNIPNTTKDSVSYSGYTSNTEYSDLNEIYDSGYVFDGKEDIYGNIFGLVKGNNNFIRNVTTATPLQTRLHVLNGYKFYDDVFGENTAFNFYQTGSFNNETLRSGISSYTNGFSARALLDTPYILNCKGFHNYTLNDRLQYPIDINTEYLFPQNVGVRDCGLFKFSDNTLLADPIPSDLSAFPGAGAYFFSELYEAGVHTAVPYVRPLLDATAPSITARFTQNVRVSANNDVIDVDCGNFLTQYNIDNITTQTSFFSSVNPESVTAYVSSTPSNDTLYERDQHSGSIYVKQTDGTVSNMCDALDYLETKYGTSTFASISSNVTHFDIVYDTFFIQTSSAIIIDKIKYVDSEFLNPKTANNIVSFNNDTYNKITNRFKVDTNVFFATMSAKNTDSLSSFMVYPTIYKFDYNSHKLEEVFPRNYDINDFTAEFTLSGNVLYTELYTPRITYMNETNTFNISYILKDQNNVPAIGSINFEYTNEVIFKTARLYCGSGSNLTTVFNVSGATIPFTPILSSGAYTQTSEYLLV